MNPLLLKPNTDTGAQVVAHAQVLGSMSARDYFAAVPLPSNGGRSYTEPSTG